MNIWKRSLSLLLAVIMVANMMPLSALAAEDTTVPETTEAVTATTVAAVETTEEVPETTEAAPVETTSQAEEATQAAPTEEAEEVVIVDFVEAKEEAMDAQADGWYWVDSTLYILDGKILEKNLYAAILEKCTNATGIKYATSKPTLGWITGGTELSNSSTKEMTLSGSCVAGCLTGKYWTAATDVKFTVDSYHNLTTSVSGANGTATLTNLAPVHNETVDVTVPHVEGKVPTAAYNNGNVALTQSGNVWTGTLTAVTSGEVTVTYVEASQPKYKVNVSVVGAGTASADVAEDYANTPVTVTANPTDSGVSNVVNYFVSIAVNGTVIEGNTFNLGNEDANVVVTFGTDSITLKEGTYEVTANTTTYADLTAEKIVAAAVAVSSGDVTVQFHHKLDGTITDWNGTDEYLPLNSENLSKYIASKDKNTFKLICGKAEATVTVSVSDARADADVTIKETREALLNGYNGNTDSGLAERIVAAVVSETNHTATPSVEVWYKNDTLDWADDYKGLGDDIWKAQNIKAGETRKVRITWGGNDDFNEKVIESDVTFVESRVAPTLSISGAEFKADTKEAFETAVKAAITATAGTVGVTFPEYTFPGEVTVTAKVTNSGETWIAGGDTTFTVKGDINTYTVTWVDGDGKTVETDENVPYGAAPEYNGATPTKTATAAEAYTFKGWDKEIAAVNGDTTYTATFDAATRSYTVTWIVDGTETTTTVAYGAMPVYNEGKNPEKENNSFAGWEPELKAVEGNITYTAKFSPDAIYEVKFMLDETTVYETKRVNATELETIAAPETNPDKDYLAFGGWDKAALIGTVPTENVTITATWLTDENNNNVADTKETVTVTANVAGPGSVDLVANDNIAITKNDNGSWTVLYNSAVEGANVVAVTATPNSTASNSVDYVVSCDATIDLTADTVVDAVFATRSITGQAGTVQYISTMTVEELKTAIFNAVITGSAPENITAADVSISYYPYLVRRPGGNDFTDDAAALGEPAPADKAIATIGYTYYDFGERLTKFSGYQDTKEKVVITGNAGTAWENLSVVTEITLEDTRVAPTIGIDESKIASYDTKEAFEAAVKAAITAPVGTVEVTFPAEYSFPGEVTVTAKVTDRGDTWTAGGDTEFTVTGVINTYTVTWVNEDGTELEKDENVPYGTVPAYNGETPTKAATAQFTYTFAGWNAEAAAVTGDVTYTATYSAATNSYTVKWVNEDTVVKEETVEYGKAPTAPADPVKAATAQYTFTFDKWVADGNVAEDGTITGTVTYTASYTETLNKYTITFDTGEGAFANGDKVITGTYNYGAPLGTGIPVRAADAEFTYEFAGWSPAVVPVAGDATYTATYTATRRSYTITWKNEDGTVLETDENVLYGETPTYNGTEPTKAADNATTWTFTGWTPAVSTVTGDAVYTAKFDEGEAVKYKVTWYDENGTTVLGTADWAYGSTPNFVGSTPTKAGNAQYTYTFAGWVPVSGVAEDGTITGEASYKASFTAAVNKYTVTWKNEDGTALKTDSVEYGAVPAFEGTPTKAATAQYSYTFAGWDKDVVAVTGDVTYTATYTATVNKYTVTWVDGNGKETTSQVEYGKIPAYTGETPVKDATDSEVYTFNNTWSPAIVSVTQDATYTAQFTAAARKYTITWVDGNGSTTTDEVAYGTVPTAPETVVKDAEGDFIYNFAGWDVTPVEVTGAAAYTATFDKALNAKPGTIYLNPLSGLRDGLKGKVLAAAGLTDAAENYTVSIKGTLTYDVEATGISAAGLVIELEAAVAKGEAPFIIAREGVDSVTVTMTIEDARQILAITASQETIEFSGKTEVEGVQDAVKALFTITATDPATGDKTNVQVSDSYVDWSPSYEWPEDAQEKTFTVTVKVNSIADATYQNAPSAKVTVTLKDTTVFYTVTYLDGYNAEGSNVVATYTIAENQAMQTPENPTREYYTFTGWDVTPAETVTENVTYTAAWQITNDANKNNTPDELDIFTVRFVDGEKVLNTVENLKAGDATPAFTPAETDAPAENQKFSHWIGYADTVAASQAAEGTCVITYQAAWMDREKVNVTFMVEGETYGEVQQLTYGATAQKPADPTRENYIFSGWYNGETLYVFDTEVKENLTLTAKWLEDFNGNNIDDATEARYTVTYMDGETELEVYTDVLTGTKAPKLADPVKDKHIFAGWYAGETAYDFESLVTGNVTLTAKWLADSNGNEVDDAMESITFAISEGGKVTVGLLTYTDGQSHVYDSKTATTVTIKAAPETDKGLFTEDMSITYVKSITVNGEPVELTYADDYSVSVEIDVTGGSARAAGGHEVAVEFAPAEFVYNETRLLNYYPGMKDVKNEDVYNAIVKTPALPGEFSIQYKAREATSQDVNLAALFGNESLIEKGLQAALKLVNMETITIDLPVLWQDVNVETDEGLIENAPSLDQAAAAYLNKEKVQELLNTYNEVAEANGGLILGALDGAKAVAAEIEEAIEAIKNAAMYNGAHNFGHNATGEETVTEIIKITYGGEAMYIEGQSDITLKDMRLPSYMRGSNIQVMYRDYTDEDLAALIGVEVIDGTNPIEGAVVTSVDITDPYTFEGKNVSDTAYTLTFLFGGNETYKPCEGTYTVTVVKAGAKLDVPNQIVTYGDAYSMLDPSYLTLENKYGDPAEITDSMIQFVLGLDVAELDVNKDGVTGLDGRVQLILPEHLQSMLDGILGITGGKVEEGIELSLSDLFKYLEPIKDTSLEALKQALEAITKITEAAELKVVLGGSMPTDVGAYLYGAVSTSANYSTVFDVAYIVIKPEATQVYLDWNYTDTNGVFTYELLDAVDLGASAYDDPEFTTLNEVATEAVNNLIFGVEAGWNSEAKEPTFDLKLALYPAGDDAENIEKDLGIGAYTQLAFVVEFGNKLYYAIPAVRAFVLVPNTVKVEIGDETDTNKAVFNNQPQSLDVTVTYDGQAFQVDKDLVTVNYTGLQSNTKTYNSTVAPTHAGAYLVSAMYVQQDGNKIIALGADVETLVIEPAKSTVEVTDKTVKIDPQNPDKTYPVADMITAKSAVEGLTPDTTVVVANVSMSQGEAVIGANLNVDLPKWLDELLAEKGLLEGKVINNKTLTDALTKVEDAVKNLDLDQSILNQEQILNSLNSLKSVLSSLPAESKITLNDNFAPKEAGVYAVIALVTDSDHYPSLDAGLMIIQPELQKVTLDWNYTDINNNYIFTLETVKKVDLSAYAVENEQLDPTEIYLGVDATNWTVQLTKNQSELTNGAYTEVAFLLSTDGVTVSYAAPISRSFLVVPGTADVKFVDQTGAPNADRKFTYDGTAHAMPVAVDGYAYAGPNLTVTYIGVQSNGETYNSTEAPVHTGVYDAIAAYIERDANGALYKVGMDVGVMAILPATAEIDVENKSEKYFDGISIKAADLVTVSGTVNNEPVNTTIITAQVATDGTFSENGLSALKNTVNVDFPAWLDTYLKKVPALAAGYEDGIKSVSFLDQATDLQEKLAALKIDSTVLNGVVKLLQQLPSGVTLTFRDDIAYNAVGTYLTVAVITDSNYVPAMDAGMLVIYPNVELGELAWVNMDSNNIYYKEALDMLPGYLDAKYIQNEMVDPTELFLGVDAANWKIVLLNKQPSTAGVYTEIAYLADLNSNAYFALPIMRPVVVVDGIYIVTFLDENGEVNHDRLYTYDGQPHGIGTVDVHPVEYAGTSKLTLTYTGVDCLGNPYKSSEAPTNAGAYVATAVFTETDASGKIIGGGAAVGTVVIQKADLALDMKDTEVVYDGTEKFVEVTSNDETADYLTIIVDKQANIANIILEDDTTVIGGVVKAMLEKALGKTLDNEFDVTEFQTAIHKAIDEVEAFQIPAELKAIASKLPADMQKALAELEGEYNTLKAELDKILAAVQNEIPVSGKVVFNGKTPVNAGTYQFYGIAVSGNYHLEVTQGVLTIKPAEVTVTMDNVTVAVGDPMPTAWTYTVEPEANEAVVSLTDAKSAAENTETAGTYEITAAAESTDPNYTVTLIPGTLTVVGITAEPDSVELEIGDSETVTITTTVEGAEVTGAVSGDETVATVTVDENGNVIITAVGVGETEITVTITMPDGTELTKVIPVTAKQNLIPIEGLRPDSTVEIEGKEYPTDENGIIWITEEEFNALSEKDHLIATSYDFSVSTSEAHASDPNADIHKTYPDMMYVWYLTVDTVNRKVTAEPIEELNDFLVYQGTSIRWSTDSKTKPGIRLITSMNVDARAKLMAGELLGSNPVDENDPLDNYRLVEYGTIIGRASEVSSLVYGAADTAISYAYQANPNGGADLVKPRNFHFDDKGNVWYTGMFVDLDPKLSNEELLIRPYIKLQKGNTEPVIIHGGIVQRTISHVAYQNRDYMLGTAANDYIRSLIGYPVED